MKLSLLCQKRNILDGIFHNWDNQLWKNVYTFYNEIAERMIKVALLCVQIIRYKKRVQKE
jgi:hypothetical protein